MKKILLLALMGSVIYAMSDKELSKKLNEALIDLAIGSDPKMCIWDLEYLQSSIEQNSSVHNKNVHHVLAKHHLLDEDERPLQVLDNVINPESVQILIKVIKKPQWDPKEIEKQHDQKARILFEILKLQRQRRKKETLASMIEAMQLKIKSQPEEALKKIRSRSKKAFEKILWAAHGAEMHADSQEDQDLLGRYGFIDLNNNTSKKILYDQAKLYVNILDKIDRENQ